ncbi:MAG: AbrB family transcriptional regulator [Nitrososphaerales archaeon]
MSKTETTTVGIARPSSDSLRATIPRGIVVFLGVSSGDQLEWRMEVGEKGERLAVVRKVK